MKTTTLKTLSALLFSLIIGCGIDTQGLEDAIDNYNKPTPNCNSNSDNDDPSCDPNYDPDNPDDQPDGCSTLEEAKFSAFSYDTRMRYGTPTVTITSGPEDMIYMLEVRWSCTNNIQAMGTGDVVYRIRGSGPDCWWINDMMIDQMEFNPVCACMVRTSIDFDDCMDSYSNWQ